MSNAPWWKGKNGEWYVVIQIILFLLVLLGPRNGLGLPPWTFPYKQFGPISGGLLVLLVGGVLIVFGGMLFITAVFRLGTNLTAVPYPKDGGTLVETGPYRFVRHPIYCGLVFVSFGYAIWAHGWLTIGYAIILLIFFDIKSRQEEKWLSAKYPDYAAYQKRVRKLIPFIY
jgi:protein-S-isoprenylcysteine O-methyltransferase Ste14